MAWPWIEWERLIDASDVRLVRTSGGLIRSPTERKTMNDLPEISSREHKIAKGVALLGLLLIIAALFLFAPEAHADEPQPLDIYRLWDDESPDAVADCLANLGWRGIPGDGKPQIYAPWQAIEWCAAVSDVTAATDDAVSLALAGTVAAGTR